MVTTIVVVAVVIAVVRRGRGRRLRARRGRGGGAGLVLAIGARLFPPERREWAQAMLAELDEVHGSFARWRFALGGVRAGLVAWGREALPVGFTAVVLAVAGGIGAVAYAVSPVTPELAIALSVALALAGISSPRRRAARATTDVVLGATVLVGVAASVALTLFGVAAFPAVATDDGTSAAYSVVLAAALGAYAWVGLGGWPAGAGQGPGPASARRGQMLVGLLLGAGLVVAGVVSDHRGAVALVVGAGSAGVVAAVGFGAGLARRGTSERGLVATGLHTGLVAGLAYFVAGMSATYLTASWPVHDREVLDGFRASGGTDLSTYMVSSSLGGSIVALVGLPALVLGAVWAGGAFARPRPRRGPGSRRRPAAATATVSALGEAVR